MATLRPLRLERACGTRRVAAGRSAGKANWPFGRRVGRQDGRRLRRSPLRDFQGRKDGTSRLPIGPAFPPHQRIGTDAAFAQPAPHDRTIGGAELSTRGRTHIPHGIGRLGDGIGCARRSPDGTVRDAGTGRHRGRRRIACRRGRRRRDLALRLATGRGAARGHAVRRLRLLGGIRRRSRRRDHSVPVCESSPRTSGIRPACPPEMTSRAVSCHMPGSET